MLDIGQSSPGFHRQQPPRSQGGCSVRKASSGFIASSSGWRQFVRLLRGASMRQRCRPWSRRWRLTKSHWLSLVSGSEGVLGVTPGCPPCEGQWRAWCHTGLSLCWSMLIPISKMLFDALKAHIAVMHLQMKCAGKECHKQNKEFRTIVTAQRETQKFAQLLRTLLLRRRLPMW